MKITRVSITHLVFGLIFLGITALWVVGATTDLEAPALAVWGPVVLIASGVVGLAATVFNARTTGSAPPAESDDHTPEHTPEHVPATVADEEQS
jgi:hypothetical protein